MLNVIIYLLVISCLSIRIVISDDDGGKKILKRLNSYFERNGQTITEDSGISFDYSYPSVMTPPCLHVGAKTVVWKGKFYKMQGNRYLDHGTDVAIKLFHDIFKGQSEVQIYKQLNAYNNPDILRKGLPNVYFEGAMLGNVKSTYGYAMTLLGESLEDVFQQNRYAALRETDVLRILLEAVKILHYIHKKRVIHCDIKPQNILFRGTKVFIADFDAAIELGMERIGGSYKFASANAYVQYSEPTPKDDLESLIYSLWYVSDISLGDEKKRLFGTKKVKTEGEVVIELRKNGKDVFKKRWEGKISKFINPVVKTAFEYVCKKLLSDDETLDHKDIIDYLSLSINNTGGLQPFAWSAQSSQS